MANDFKNKLVTLTRNRGLAYWNRRSWNTLNVNKMGHVFYV
jgi:hypothetical protein